MPRNSEVIRRRTILREIQWERPCDHRRAGDALRRDNRNVRRDLQALDLEDARARCMDPITPAGNKER
jgi:hypothetical protein